MSLLSCIPPSNPRVLLLAQRNELTQYAGEVVQLPASPGESIAKCGDGTFEVVAAISDSPYDSSLYSHVFRVLAPGGLFLIRTAESVSKDFSKGALYAGFTLVEKKDNGATVYILSSSLTSFFSTVRCVVCFRLRGFLRSCSVRCDWADRRQETVVERRGCRSYFSRQ